MKHEDLLQPAGRPLEVVFGVLCLLIGVSFSLLALYVVWSLSRKGVAFGWNFLLVVCIPSILGFFFLTVSYSLIRAKGAEHAGMSPLALRLTALIILAGAALALILGVLQEGVHGLDRWAYFTLAFSTAGALLVLASRRAAHRRRQRGGERISL